MRILYGGSGKTPRMAAELMAGSPTSIGALVGGASLKAGRDGFPLRLRAGLPPN